MESINEVLVEVVRVLGGFKAVGAMLWPEKAPDAAQRSLLDCLNAERAAHLSPEQMVLLLRKAKQKGYHEGIEWLMSDLGYERPVPVDPQVEMAKLLREFSISAASMTVIAERLEKLKMDAIHVGESRPSLRAD